MLVLISLFLTAQACSGANPKIVKLAIVAPFSGRHRAIGDNVLPAARLAAGEWNSSGGVAGYRIELVAQDDRNDGEGGALQARKMIIDPDVIGVVGHFQRSSILAAASEYQRADMPALAMGALPEALAENGRVLGMTAGEKLVARAMARFIAQSGSGSVALITDDSTSQEESRLIREALAERNISAPEVHIDVTSDRRLAAQRVLAEAPDLALFYGSFIRGAGLLKELRATGSKAAYLGGADHALPDFLLAAGDAVEGAYYVSLAPHHGNTAFAQTYRAKFGVEPTAWASLVYDATNMMLTAVERTVRSHGEPSRAAVAEALAGIRDYVGLSGTISPSDRGNLSEPKVHVYRVSGPRFPGQLVWSGGAS